MSRVRLIVINEHTLGAQHPNGMVDVLHASVLKGAPFEYLPEPKMIFSGDKVRLASEKDFNDFRVSFKGYDNPEEYEYN